MEYRLSLVVVALDAEETIADTLNSIESQQPDEVEVIFVIGPSRDNTQKLIENFCRGHVGRSWYFDEGSGIYDAYNQGIASASGDYVMFLNSDDWLADLALGSILQTLSSNEKREYYNFAVEYYSFVGSFIRAANGRRRLPSFFLMPFCFPSTVFSKRAITHIGGFDARYKLAADLDLVFKFLSEYGWPHFSTNVIYCFRRGGRSSFRASLLDIFVIIKKHFGLVRAVTGIIFRILVKLRGLLS